MYIDLIRALPTEIVKERFQINEEVIEVIKSLADTQIDKLTKTNQLLIAFNEDAICQLSPPKF